MCFVAARMSAKKPRRACSRSSSGARSTDDGWTVAITGVFERGIQKLSRRADERMARLLFLRVAAEA